MGDTTEVVARLGAQGYRTQIEAGGHALVADEPASVGGTDEGPSPYDLLAAALGACTTMTLRMYARRKEWELTGVVVKVRQQRVHAKDCEDCESETGFIHEIEREISLEGELSGEQRARLMEIADKCPVHKTLEGEIKIRTRGVQP